MPVPLSPVSSTVVSARETLPMRALIFRMTGPTPTSSPRSWGGGPSGSVAASRPLRVAIMSSCLKGLVMKSTAPWLRAATVVSVVA
ncbi:MAG TPA: hypothetical protein DHV93_10010 [Holophagaceae bacterium]|nr:hypothetical protein [Holophagaceae bacterium]